MIHSEVLRLHSLGLNVVPIQPNTKVPPQGFPLKPYLRDRQSTPEQIQEWTAGPCNIAVCMGDVSDGAVDRDFDSDPAYHAWAVEHPRLARTLPTAKTPRGFRVLCRAHMADVDDIGRGRRRIICDRGTGELKALGYSLVPDSVVDGVPYQWIVPPDDIPFVGDLRAAGLVPVSYTATNSLKSGRGVVHGDLAGELLPAKLLATEGSVEDRARRGIRACVPIGYRQRNNCIWRLCRTFRAIPEFDPSDPLPLKPWVREWHGLALPYIRTKSFAVSWGDFCYAYPLVRNPARQSLQAVIAGVSGSFDVDHLAAVCEALQRQWGDQPFPLDQRAVAAPFGTNPMRICRWLKKLRGSVLYRTLKGNNVDHRASEYLFLPAFTGSSVVQIGGTPYAVADALGGGVTHAITRRDGRVSQVAGRAAGGRGEAEESVESVGLPHQGGQVSAGSGGGVRRRRDESVRLERHASVTAGRTGSAGEADTMRMDRAGNSGDLRKPPETPARRGRVRRSAGRESGGVMAQLAARSGSPSKMHVQNGSGTGGETSATPVSVTVSVDIDYPLDGGAATANVSSERPGPSRPARGLAGAAVDPFVDPTPGNGMWADDCRRHGGAEGGPAEQKTRDGVEQARQATARRLKLLEE